VFELYRFDDQYQSAATVSASPVPSSALMADPVIWHNFFSEKDVPWILLRGRLGFRRGDLIVKGDGSSPVILAPKEPPIEWSRYETVEIQMLSEGGTEVKIKIGNDEYKHKLGPLRQYNDYRFDVHIAEPGSRPLAIMPTDGLFDLVAIKSIRLVPKKANFPQAVGRQFIGKREEYRHTLYVHSPSTVTFEVPVPKGARLHLGMGITEKNSSVKFRVVVDGSRELYSNTITDPDAWEDANLDLSSYAGRNVKLAFETRPEKPGAVALWANPLMTTEAPKRLPNVVMYMIDTLRADHSSLHGYPRDTTPYLKKLGAQGLVFEDCQVQATWTKPSTASLLTSLYSFTHGIINDYDTIPKGATTLAEQLRESGYVTAGIVANPFAGRISGLQRGFDYLSEWAVIQRYRTDAEDRGTDSAAVNKIAFPWLERHRDEPFFLYAHTTDPHAPYRPPAGFEEKFANPADTAEFNRNYKKLRELGQYGGGTVISPAGCARSGVNPGRFIHRAIDRYDGEILHNDWSLEQLAGKLRQLGILDNTLIVVVSDHGEEFWEHGWTAHGQSLYQELTHGVFAMWNPKLIPTPRRVSEPVQLIDVMPTILDLLGQKIPDLVEGQSLAAFVKGEAFQRRGPVMTSRYASPHARGFVPENGTDTVALLDANWKLLYRDKAKDVGLKKVELYNRRTDLGEAKNVAVQHPQEVERMLGEINRWMDAQKQIKSFLGRGAKATMDQQTLDQLRSLGYIGGKQ
jgi:arylsulfatase A-like enzyme